MKLVRLELLKIKKIQKRRATNTTPKLCLDIILKLQKKNGKIFGLKKKYLNQKSTKVKKNSTALRCFHIHLEKYTWDM